MEDTEVPVATTKKRYKSPDVFKGIAIIAIVFIHLFVMVGTTGSGHGELVKSKPILEYYIADS